MPFSTFKAAFGGISTTIVAILNHASYKDVALSAAIGVTITFFLPKIYQWLLEQVQKKVISFSITNTKKHKSSTIIGFTLLAVLAACIWPLKVATFTEISPMLIIIIPFLLYGKSTSNQQI
jgi:uncharacterized protein YacL